jgi:hypothetical protein
VDGVLLARDQFEQRLPVAGALVGSFNGWDPQADPMTGGAPTASGPGRGAWTRGYSTTICSWWTDAPAGTCLLGVAPNPVRPATAISFALAEAGPYRIAVFDLSGREVACLAEAWMAAGRHAVSWNGRSDSGAMLPSGVGFATLRAGGRTESRKIVLTK